MCMHDANGARLWVLYLLSVIQSLFTRLLMVLLSGSCFLSVISPRLLMVLLSALHAYFLSVIQSCPALSRCSWFPFSTPPLVTDGAPVLLPLVAPGSPFFSPLSYWWCPCPAPSGCSWFPCSPLPVVTDGAPVLLPLVAPGSPVLLFL